MNLFKRLFGSGGGERSRLPSEGGSERTAEETLLKQTSRSSSETSDSEATQAKIHEVDEMATLRKPVSGTASGSGTTPTSGRGPIPADAMPYFNQAEDASRQQRWSDAVEAYERAFEICESVPDAWCQYGLVLNNLGRFDDAEVAFRKSIELDPNLANAYGNLGVLLVRDMGRPDEAEEMLLKALEIDPSHGARENLNILRRKYRKPDSSAIKNYLCDSCGTAFTNVGTSNSTAIGGADIAEHSIASLAYRAT